MGIPVLIIGESGSGKSASLRNFNEDDLLIFNVASKPLAVPQEAKFNQKGYIQRYCQRIK